jgi:hypothetical protein
MIEQERVPVALSTSIEADRDTRVRAVRVEIDHSAGAGAHRPRGASLLGVQDDDARGPDGERKQIAQDVRAREDENQAQRYRRNRNRQFAASAAALLVFALFVVYVAFIRPRAPVQTAAVTKPQAPPQTDWKAIDAKATLGKGEEDILSGKSQPQPQPPGPTPKPVKHASSHATAPPPRRPAKGPDLTPEEQAALLAIQSDPRGPGLPDHGVPHLVADDGDKDVMIEKETATIDPGILRQRVKSIKPGLNSCVTNALQRNPNLHLSKVEVTITVAPSGAVTETRFDQASFGETELGHCIQGVLGRMVLPQFKGEPTQAEFPLALSAGS